MSDRVRWTQDHIRHQATIAGWLVRVYEYDRGCCVYHLTLGGWVSTMRWYPSVRAAKRAATALAKRLERT